jgi:hypothetical protein
VTEEIYGSGFKASTLAREIRKVKYPGLDLAAPDLEGERRSGT